ncbi:uncharacterized protein A1O9_02864 [Exophiala aquamarina CBS 119918]|uniref:Helicase ATP-binding domain-containing protein n=1 Tax=Exophiala aquamarina CBS 119918 TaxID=1182545 RepID=A0A072PMM1_9EURO|nr:uncharacterized protein A1O9_02864 [Exophiala aquamarina CBS 119918]KEF61299.1 hypothetical protein A1O9_02864 [Exophiala aquamarina CBS 119918]
MNANLSERFRGSRYQNAYSSANPNICNGLELNLSLDIRNYFLKQKEIKESSRKENWLAIPEIPTFEELLVGEMSVAVPPNKIDGPYKSKDRYLKTQYTLLREDAVGSLRDAILDFQKDPTTMDTFKFSVYDQVHISGFTFSRRGLAARIKFCTNRAGKKISWMTTKRLTSGSIVALIRKKDKMVDFSGVITAIVAARPLAGVLCEPPEIDIYFGRPEDIQVDPQEEWIMIEAKQGYFEAYRHTLQALQKLHQEKYLHLLSSTHPLLTCRSRFPLSDTICHLSPASEPPNYIQQRPVLDFSAAAEPNQKSVYSKVDVTGTWPPAPSNMLDESQWQAFREMFTKNLSIIQGPPGTGKTHISKVAIQALQENRLAGDPPLIIAAQTNHALDQLLGHISKFDPNYVRLGGRSTNPEVKKRALFEIRQNERIKQVPGGMFGRTNSLLDKQAKTLINILEPFTKPGSDPFSTDVTQSTTVLLQLGVLNTQQAKSLEDGASQWVSTTTPMGHGPFQLWLDTALTHFEFKYTDDNFGFPEVEDEDLEFEQLRETEDSTGVNDEEDIEMLKGPWAGIRDKVTVQPATPSDILRAEKLLATSNDLWKIPPHLRGPMYLVIRSRALVAIANKFRKAAAEYDKLVKDILVGKWEQDYVYLKRARIIGMTTTGLSKYRALIAALKPRTILIEEAAEILEAPVTVACVESLEHLILVGDHQQLRGHCSLHELENEPFYLNVSLFERLVRNEMPYRTLLSQRRMEPEFRRLLSSVYPALVDHSSVITRANSMNAWGMGTVKSFFFTHQWSEYKDDSLSTYNEEEAKFVAGFYRHLHKNGIEPRRITILTFYNGQRKRILKEIKNLTDITGPGTYHNVKTIDSYQGEENDIVLLSTVRSREDRKIGFLANDNRVTVALSRAKLGFYLFGNAKSLSMGSTLWMNVVNTMSANPRRIYHQLPIRCQRHQTTVLVQYPEYFHVTEGGCDQPCAKAQKQSQIGWSRFANGGVKVDDQRRAHSADQLQAHDKMDTPAVNDFQSSAIAHEMSEEIESGRTRFTQAYRVATKRSARQADTSESTDSGATVMQKVFETKEGAIEAHENTTTSAGGIMDDLAELNGYYLKS